MNAYMVVVDEAVNMVPAVEDITHIFACGGMESIAAAVFLGFFARRQHNQDSQNTEPTKIPRFVVVEPSEADCLLQSAKRESRVNQIATSALSWPPLPAVLHHPPH